MFDHFFVFFQPLILSFVCLILPNGFLLLLSFWIEEFVFWILPCCLISSFYTGVLLLLSLHLLLHHVLSAEGRHLSKLELTLSSLGPGIQLKSEKLQFLGLQFKWIMASLDSLLSGQTGAPTPAAPPVSPDV